MLGQLMIEFALYEKNILKKGKKIINNYLLLSNLTYEVKYRFMISELKCHAVLIWFIQ